MNEQVRHLLRGEALPASCPPAAPVVYIVQIARDLKIGHTKNIQSRLKQFATSAVDVRVVLVVPGGRALEQRLHAMFAEARITRELFRPHWRISGFIDHVKIGGLDRGLQYLSDTTPAKRAERVELRRLARKVEARQSKADLDTSFAAMVADRKRRLGW